MTLITIVERAPSELTCDLCAQKVGYASRPPFKWA